MMPRGLFSNRQYFLKNTVPGTTCTVQGTTCTVLYQVLPVLYCRYYQYCTVMQVLPDLNCTDGTTRTVLQVLLVLDCTVLQVLPVRSFSGVGSVVPLEQPLLVERHVAHAALERLHHPGQLLRLRVGIHHLEKGFSSV